MDKYEIAYNELRAIFTNSTKWETNKRKEVKTLLEEFVQVECESCDRVDPENYVPERDESRD